MLSKRAPLAPETLPDMPPIAGVLLATYNCGIKYKDRPDTLLATFPEGASVAGVFTVSTTASAAVHWCRKALASSQPARAVIVNAGNSNAYTGKPGEAAVASLIAATASAVQCAPEQVYQCSTGVIGVVLPAEKIATQLPMLTAGLAAGGWEAATQAISTTDTFLKLATRQVQIAGKTVTINGFAKGSGMIQPNMATMLGYIFTDASIAQPLLQKMLHQACFQSFNAITVDSDTSTSDSLLLFATNKSAAITTPQEQAVFQAALNDLCRDLAIQIVKDGEGAEKLVTITVTGALSDVSAKTIALAIANSPLVKTAVAGEDANWGRIVAAVGKSAEPVDVQRMTIHIGGVAVAANGGSVPGYDETPVAAHLKTRDIHFDIDVGVGAGNAQVWTCDLTHRYIEINADYRS